MVGLLKALCVVSFQRKTQAEVIILILYIDTQDLVSLSDSPEVIENTNV